MATDRTSISSAGGRDRPRMSMATDGGKEIVGHRVADKMLFNDHWAVTNWAKNSEQSTCYNCSKNFSIFVRYHHCRSCGNCICNTCSLFKPLPCYGYTKARVCKYCCGARYMEVQVDGRSENKEGPHAHFSRSKEAQHQTKCVHTLVNEKVFVLGKFGLRNSDYAESHGGITNTRAVNVKCFRKWLMRSAEKELIFNEINTLRIFFHPNISRVIRTNIPTDGVTMPDFPYIMTEYAEFGTLGDFLVSRYVDGSSNRTKDRTMADWQLLLRMLIQVVGTMKYLQDVHRLMHNDVHCGNILVVRDNLRSEPDEPVVLIKLGDFTNTRSSEKQISSLKPVPTHRALEIWREQPFEVSADVFSFAQTMAQVLLIKPKSFMANYPVDDVAVVIGDAISNNVMPPIGKEKSAIGIELSDIIRECWTEAPARPSLEDLEAKLGSMELRYFPAAAGKQQETEYAEDYC